MKKFNHKSRIKLIIDLTMVILKDADLLGSFEDIFEKELKPMFQDEDVNQLIDIAVLYFNKTVYKSLIKKDPSLKETFPSFKDFEEHDTEYQYHPSEAAVEEIKAILEKLLK